jgi:hypothetical protein
MSERNEYDAHDDDTDDMAPDDVAPDGVEIRSGVTTTRSSASRPPCTPGSASSRPSTA